MFAMRRQSGFTLIEIVVAVSIILLLATMGTVAYRALERRFLIATEMQELSIVLQEARDRTLASENASQYGVHFQSDRYVLFVGATYDPAALTNESYLLPAGVEVASLALAGGGSDVVFNRIQGDTVNFGTVALRLIADPTITQTLSLAAAGQAGRTGTVVTTGTRLTDTRHLHFATTSIQNATTMTLTFQDPLTTQTVTMDDYVDAGQTVFDWEGTIAVGGEDQTLRVHTHSLDAFSTVLSVRRDRRQNTKAVTIAIDGSEVVSYGADGAATAGPLGGMMTVQ